MSNDNMVSNETNILGAFQNAFRKIFIPLVKILIKQNIHYQEASRLLKETYVDVANEHFKPNSKKANTKSNISLLTGINRKEVTNILDRTDNKVHTHWRSIESDILSKWHHDRRYSESHELPNTLNITGKNSFTQLVMEVNPIANIDLTIEQMVDTHLLEKLHSGKLIPKKRYWKSNKLDISSINSFGETSYRFLTTVDHNIDVKSGRIEEPTRFLGYAFSNKIIEDERKIAINELFQKRSMAFLRTIDTELEEGENTQPSTQTIGFGMYYFEVPNNIEE